MSKRLIDVARLQDIASVRHREFVRAEPTPHTVIDDFISPQLLAKAVEEFPAPGRDVSWKTRGRSDNQRGKFGSNDVERFGPLLTALIGELTSPALTHVIETLTGNRNLTPDSSFAGGGLQQTVRGGHLRVHRDFTRHKKLNTERRINLILFLNQDWLEGYGGHLELWSKDMLCCRQRFLPTGGRCVIFDTADAPHGHPYPLTCPPGMARKSIALHYYAPVGDGNAAKTHEHGVEWANHTLESRVETYRELLRLNEIDIAGLELAAYVDVPEASSLLEQLDRRVPRAASDVAELLAGLRRWGDAPWLTAVLDLSRVAANSRTDAAITAKIRHLDNVMSDVDSASIREFRPSRETVSAASELQSTLDSVPRKVLFTRLRNELTEYIHTPTMLIDTAGGS